VTVEQAACPGGAPYAVLDDMTISVRGELPRWSGGSAQEQKLLDMWNDWGGLAERACAKHRVPLTWFMAIMAVESQGNPNACSPCNPDVCSFYPACQPCCAYGLMQMIDQTARCYGASGAELRGNPGLALDLGAAMLAEEIYGEAPGAKNCASGPYGFDLPRIATAYNCGSARCGSGTLGLCGQHDYAYNVVKYANTAAELGIPAWPSRFSVAAIGGGMLALAGIGMAYAIWTGKTKKLEHKLGL
jgi:hypothetical protein